MARVLSGWDKHPAREVPLEPLKTSRINWPVVYGLVGFYFYLNRRSSGLDAEVRSMKLAG